MHEARTIIVKLYVQILKLSVWIVAVFIVVLSSSLLENIFYPMKWYLLHLQILFPVTVQVLYRGFIGNRGLIGCLKIFNT